MMELLCRRRCQHDRLPFHNGARTKPGERRSVVPDRCTCRDEKLSQWPEDLWTRQRGGRLVSDSLRCRAQVPAAGGWAPPDRGFPAARRFFWLRHPEFTPLRGRVDWRIGRDILSPAAGG